MKKKFSLIMIVLSFFSCQKDGSHTDEEVDVYVAGTEHNWTVHVAKYWSTGRTEAP